MNTAVETHNPIGTVVDDVIARGDLSKLSPEERVVHYHNVCKSLGLNPFTQPLQYITLNGKLQLYARRDAADQLRKINGINIEVVDRSVHNDLLTVHVRATDKTGRRDEDFGVVAIGGLKGEAAANAFLKAVTKAKRRVTLSISGLGFSDETEMDDVPGAEPQPFALTPVQQARLDAMTDAEITAAAKADPDNPPLTAAEFSRMHSPDKVPSSSDDYWALWEVLMKEATSAEHLAMRWNAERSLRNNIEWRGAEHANLKAAVTRRIEELKLKATAADLATQRLNAGDA